MKRRDIHPAWCAQNHACTAHAPVGEHRSMPVAWDSHAGRILATRTQTIAGLNRLELRAIVDLPADPHAAKARAWHLVVALYVALSRAPVNRPEARR